MIPGESVCAGNETAVGQPYWHRHALAGPQMRSTYGGESQIQPHTPTEPPTSRPRPTTTTTANNQLELDYNNGRIKKNESNKPNCKRKLLCTAGVVAAFSELATAALGKADATKAADDEHSRQIGVRIGI